MTMGQQYEDEKINDNGLEEVVGGFGSTQEVFTSFCPVCNSRNITREVTRLTDKITLIQCTCNDCGHKWSKRNVKTDSGGTGTR